MRSNALRMTCSARRVNCPWANLAAARCQVHARVRLVWWSPKLSATRPPTGKVTWVVVGFHSPPRERGFP